MLRRTVLALCISASFTANAKGLSPYLPLNIAPEVELQLQKLIAITGQTPLAKPYKASELLLRLPEIRESHPLLYSRLSGYLSRYTKKVAITHRGISLSTSDKNKRTLENNRGIEHQTRVEISGAGHAFFSPYFYVAGGGIYSDESGRAATNTHIGLGTEFLQLDLGFKEHWFSPFQDSAMLVSTNAENSPSLTFSNSTPIGGWGFRYEAFYSELRKVAGIVRDEVAERGRPKLTGLHISASPLESWSVGLSRTYLYGGGQREQSLQNAFLSWTAPDQLGQKGAFDNGDEGYLQTAVSTKFHNNWLTPISVYAEFATAESRDDLGSRYTANARSVGFFMPVLFDNISFRYEYTDRDAGWYQSSYYQKGFSNDNDIMGHWSADEFGTRFAPGAKTHHLLLDWELINNQLMALRVSGQEVDQLTERRIEDTYQVQARYSFANQYGFWGVEGTYGKDAAGDDYHRVSAFFRW